MALYKEFHRNPKSSLFTVPEMQTRFIRTTHYEELPMTLTAKAMSNNTERGRIFEVVTFCS